jgi:hypothetical protein
MKKKSQREKLELGKTRFAEGFVFRSARLEDVGQIVNLEEAVWGDSGAKAAQIISRIELFPFGIFVATSGDEEIVACSSFISVDNMAIAPDFTWEEITDHGYITGSHKAKGKYAYGINLSVSHKMNGRNLGNLMVFYGLMRIITGNKKGVFIGSRIPGFKNYKKHYPLAAAEDYVTLKRNGRLRDYELRLYAAEGFKVIKVLPDYFPDPDSLDYGVLVYCKNPVYNFPCRNLLGDIFWQYGRVLPLVELLTKRWRRKS